MRKHGLKAEQANFVQPDNEYRERTSSKLPVGIFSNLFHRRRSIHELLGQLQMRVVYKSTFSSGPVTRIFLHLVPFLINLVFMILYFLDRDVDVDVEGGPCFTSDGVPSDYWIQPRDYGMWFAQALLSFLLFFIWMPVRALITGNSKERFSLVIGILIDLVTLLPFIVSTFLGIVNWYSPTFLRVWISYIELRLFVNPKTLRHEVILFFFIVLAGGLTITAVFEWAQNNFPKDPEAPYNIDDPPTYACTSFTDSLYWLVVTFSTVGYGDVTPVNKLTKWIVGLTIVLFIVLLPSALSKITSMWERYTGWTNRRYEISEDISHVVVSGRITAALSTIIHHYFHPVRRLHHYARQAAVDGSVPPSFAEDVVLQCDAEPDDEVIHEVIHDVRFHKSNIYLQQGRIETDDGRRRCHLKRAAAAFVFPTGFRSELIPTLNCEDVGDTLLERDYNTLLRAWSVVSNVGKGATSYVIVYHESNAKLMEINLANEAERAFAPGAMTKESNSMNTTMKRASMTPICIDQFQQTMLAASLEIKGISTMVTNLLIGEDSFILDSPFTSQANPACDTYQYLDSLQQSIHVVRNKTFSNWTIRELAGTCLVGFELILLGLYPGKLDCNTIGSDDMSKFQFSSECLNRVILPQDSLIVIGKSSDADELAEVTSSDFHPEKRNSQKARQRKSGTRFFPKRDLADVRIEIPPLNRLDSNLTINSIRSHDSADVEVVGAIDAQSQFFQESRDGFLAVGTALDMDEAQLLPLTPTANRSESVSTPSDAAQEVPSLAFQGDVAQEVSSLGSQDNPLLESSEPATTSAPASIPGTPVANGSATAVLGADGKGLHIRDHVIVCGCAYLRYERLLQELRKPHLIKGSVLRPVVFLLDSKPSEKTWSSIARYGAVYWMIGKGHYSSSLIAAGIENAYAVLTSNDPYQSPTFGGDEVDRHVKSLDRNSLLAARLCFRLKRDLGLNRLRVIADLNRVHNTEYMSHFRHAFVGDQPSAIEQVKCDCSSSHSKSLMACGGSVRGDFLPCTKEFTRAVHWYRQLWYPLTSPSYISGESWSVDCLAFLAFRLHAPGGYMMLALTRRLLQQVNQPGGIRMIDLPLTLEENTYRTAFLNILSTFDGVLVGVFRRGAWSKPEDNEGVSKNKRKPVEDERFRGVLLNPSPSLVLHRGDQLYILGGKDDV